MTTPTPVPTAKTAVVIFLPGVDQTPAATLLIDGDALVLEAAGFTGRFRLDAAGATAVSGAFAQYAAAVAALEAAASATPTPTPAPTPPPPPTPTPAPTPTPTPTPTST